ncbi:hypothetical protein PP1_005110 [Pseudonocardia sp. P1]
MWPATAPPILVSMDLITSPDADPVERALGTVRRVAVPVAVGLLVLVALLAGQAAEDEVAARYDATRTTATVLHTRPDAGGAPVPVTWNDPRDGIRVADVAVGEVATAGRTVTLWLDADGEPTTPRWLAEARTAGVLRTASVLVAGGLLVLLADRWARSVGRGLAAERLDREWRAAELRWREHPAG